MNGSNINAAASGLFQGIQYMDGRNQQKQQNERQLRLDTLNEQRESRRAEMDGLTLQKTQAELQEFEANAPLREQERKTKQYAYDAAANTREAEKLLMSMEQELGATKSIDNSLRAINDRIGDGLDYAGSTIDPKTGAITVRRVDPDTKAEYENKYTNLQDLQSKARIYMGDEKAWQSNWDARIKAQQKAIADAEELAKDERKHGQKKELTQLEIEGRTKAAQIGADSRLAAAEAKLEATKAAGGLRVTGDPNGRVLEYTKLFTGKAYKTADGKPAVMTVDEANVAARAIVDKEMGGAPAAGGVNPRPAPAAIATPSAPTIDFSKYKTR